MPEMTPPTMARRKRRTHEEQIRDLEEELANLKRKVRDTPARKQARQGQRALEKALELAKDGEVDERELTKALQAALKELQAVLGEAPAGGARRIRRSSADLESLASRVVSFLEDHSPASIGDVSDGVGESTKDLRPVMQLLLAEGRVKKSGERRGTRYFL